MNKFLLGAAAIMAMTAPGAANAASGYLDLSYANASADSGSDADVISYGGAVNFDLGGLGAQGDVHWARASGGSSAITIDQGALHAFNRTDNYLFGGFVSVEDLSSAAGTAYDFGVEGQIYLSRVTIDGGVSYTDFDTADENGTRLRLGATFFATDNFSIGANGQRLEVDGDELATYGATLEWKPASMPASFFGGYRQTQDDLIVGNDIDTWEVGVRWNLGTGTLIERNRSGASLTTASTLVGGIY